MNEFLNRIDAQRDVIKLVNNRGSSFPLAGLSAMSLDRWRIENSFEIDCWLFKSLIQISSKLFFLSNKSQEQITEEYKLLSKEMYELIKALEKDLVNRNLDFVD